MGKHVNALLKEMCSSIGYIKKGELFIKEINSDTYSTVHFNLASYQIKGHVLVAPMIGLHYERVEQLLKDIANYSWLKRYNNTIYEHIGYIMPNDACVEWDFLEYETNPENTINSFKNAIQQFARVYYERFPNYESIISYILENRSWNPINYHCYARLPILYYLVGQKQKGIDFINKALMNYCEANMLYTDEYIANYIKLP